VIVNPREIVAKTLSTDLRTMSRNSLDLQLKGVQREWDAVRPGKDLMPDMDIVQPAEAHDQVWGARVKGRSAICGGGSLLVRRNGFVSRDASLTGWLSRPCYKKGDLTCISCHAMHNSKPDDQLHRK
jgi:hypothetical protein